MKAAKGETKMVQTLYEAIEEAVREKKPVKIPDGIILKTGYAPTGTTFTIPGLYWMDEERNIYEACFRFPYSGWIKFWNYFYVSERKPL